MNLDLEKLKKFLLESNLVTQKDIESAEKKATEKNVPLGDVLVSEGKVGEDDFRRVQAYLLGIPFVSLKDQRIDFETLSTIPEPVARNHNIVAFRKDPDSLEVAMLDPRDLEAIEFIRKKTNLKILPRLTDTESIKSALLQYQKNLQAAFGEIIEKEAASLKSLSVEEGREEVSAEDLEKLASDLPIVRIVDTLLSHAIIQRASDIHIEPEEKELVIRYRIDGILHDAMILPKSASAGIVARIKVLSNLRLDEKRLPQDGRFKIEREGEKVSFRVSTLPTFFGEKVVLRLLPETSRGFSLENLGFHGQDLEALHAAMKQTTGMILATGPTGSGKTTTLYTILELLNKPEVNISTVEDPIEYQIARINQTQVKPEIGFTFASGLRSLVRQDPDILMVGEIRDKETIGLAINASLTGHLVLSTLHTNSAAGAVPRMIDMGAEPFLLVSTVNVIIAQRLVRRLCRSKEVYNLPKPEIARLKKTANLDRVLEMLKEEKIVKPSETLETLVFYKPKISNECSDGYSGRLGIHEVLMMSSSVKNLIMNNATADALEEQARKEGMLTMIEDGIYKAAAGLTSLEEVFRVAMT